MDKDKAVRERKLLGDIELWASVAKNNPRHAQKRVAQILGAVLELHHGRKMNTTQREALVKSLSECTLGEPGSIELDGNRLYINEQFDCRELAKKLVW